MARGPVAWLLKDAGLRFISVVIAVGAWLYVNQESTEQQLVQARVEVKGNPALVQVSPPIPPITVKVQGRRSVLAKLHGRQLQFQEDLSSTKPGKQLLVLDGRALQGLPPEAHVLSVLPAAIELEFEEAIDKEVTVVLSQRGRLPRGYELLTLLAEPSTVVLHGGRSRLENVTEIPTRPVLLEGRTTDFEGTVALDLTGIEGWLEGDQSGEVTVRATVKAVPIERAVSGVTVEVPEDWNVLPVPDRLVVTVRGLRTALDKLDPSEIVAKVRGRSIPSPLKAEWQSKGKGNAPLDLRAPEGIQILNVEPTIVELVSP